MNSRATSVGLDYFGQQVFLAQSPQFYKQMMVGIYERVFEVAPVFRAEKHNTSPHLNEYVSMDLEMGFIEGFHDIMDMETGALKYIFRFLQEEYPAELNLLGAQLPVFDSIPVIKFKKAKEIIAKTYHRAITDEDDFEPEEEKLICQYAQDHCFVGISNAINNYFFGVPLVFNLLKNQFRKIIRTIFLTKIIPKVL